jgi:hypothetical protein
MALSALSLAHLRGEAGLTALQRYHLVLRALQRNLRSPQDLPSHLSTVVAQAAKGHHARPGTLNRVLSIRDRSIHNELLLILQTTLFLLWR